MYHDVGDQDVTYGVYVTGNRANASQCYELHVDVEVLLLSSLLELRYVTLTLLDIQERCYEMTTHSTELDATLLMRHD